MKRSRNEAVSVMRDALRQAAPASAPTMKRVYHGMNGVDYEAELEYIKKLDAEKAAPDAPTKDSKP